MKDQIWAGLAARQEGLLSRRQLNALGITHNHVRREVEARRWVCRTPTVISTATGPMSWEQRVWMAVLHAGGSALVGGLTALEWHGLKNWHRQEITVLVDDELAFDPVEGIAFFRTRRSLSHFRDRFAELPIARVEPATLLFAGYERSARTAQGAIAAVVQQRLSTADRLSRELETMRPLRRAKVFRQVLSAIEGGAQSLAEVDVGRMCREFDLPRPRRQTRRRDASGRFRFTDCEWPLPDGTLLVLEVDGAFHMEVAHWEDDLARHRKLSVSGAVIVRCTARELRDESHSVAHDLIALGLSRSCA